MIKIILSFIWESFVFLMSIIQIILIPVIFLTVLEIIFQLTEKPRETYITQLIIEIIMLFFNGIFLAILEHFEE